MSPTREFGPDPDPELDYGLGNLQILASNNPGCFSTGNNDAFSPRKLVLSFADTDAGFSTIYEDKLHGEILEVLGDLQLVSSLEGFHVLRLGFDNTSSSLPVVLLFIFQRNTITSSAAKEIVDRIAPKLSLAWSGEQISIDVCQRMPLSEQDTRAEQYFARGLAQTLNYEFVYDDPYPLPGASIGPDELESCTGTLCGYLAHGSEVFALTNNHVVNGSGHEVLGSHQPYSYYDTGKNKEDNAAEIKPKHIIHSPSNTDHRASISSMATEIRLGFHNVSAKDMEKAESYSRYLGYLYATSGAQPPEHGKPRQDWALIHVDSHVGSSIRNKHRRQAGFQPTRKQISQLLSNDVDETWAYATVQHLAKAPLFGDVCAEPFSMNDPYLKPPSARSEARVGQFNGIRSTVFLGPWGLTREWIFCCPIPRMEFCEIGDSGSSILDKNYNVVGMLWGGRSTYEIGGALTYVTPISDILQDIENRMGWDKGSCRWITEGM